MALLAIQLPMGLQSDSESSSSLILKFRRLNAPHARLGLEYGSFYLHREKLPVGLQIDSYIRAHSIYKEPLPRSFVRRHLGPKFAADVGHLGHGVGSSVVPLHLGLLVHHEEEEVVASLLLRSHLRRSCHRLR